MRRPLREVLRERPLNDWLEWGIPLSVFAVGSLVLHLVFNAEDRTSIGFWLFYGTLSLLGLTLLRIGLTRPSRRDSDSSPD